MKLSPLRLAITFFALIAMGMPIARAHEFKMDLVINAFVKVEPGEAQLVVRAPLFLFKAARIPIRNGEIDVDNAATALERSTGLIERSVILTENGKPLVASGGTARLSLPSDRSFTSYEDARAHVAQAPEPDTRIYVDQGYVDARITYPIGSPNSEFSIHSTAAPELGDSLKVAVRYMPLTGDERSMVVMSSSGTVALNPTWWRAAGTFTGLGIEHILTGYDHLLFLLCLVIPLRGWRKILSVVTVFTIAHSFTLLGTAFNLAPSGAWFPPFVETAIAASIVYMALENIMGVRLERRILITGLFGLIHGFGFSYGLQENFQFAGTHLIVSLLAFNVGIELGQLLVLALMLPVLALVRRYVLPGKVGMIIMSAIAADTGWHWMLDRGGDLWATHWPRPTLAGVAVLAVWIAGICAAAGGIGYAAKRLKLGDNRPSSSARSALAD